MNDNKSIFRDVEVRLPAYFMINAHSFDFFRFMPGLEAVDVYERRLVRQGRQCLVQFADEESFPLVTAFRFFAK